MRDHIIPVTLGITYIFMSLQPHVFNKSKVRAELRRRRKLLSVDERYAKSRKLASLLLSWFARSGKAYTNNKIVLAGYYAVGTECSVTDILAAWPGKTTLPCIENNTEHLVFRHYDRSSLMSGPGTMIPQPDMSQREYSPDIVLVPLLGFTASGQRLGQGQGWYDRTLSRMRETTRSDDRLPLLAVGIGFSCQEMAVLPTEPHDQPLDVVATDNTIIECV